MAMRSERAAIPYAVSEGLLRAIEGHMSEQNPLFKRVPRNPRLRPVAPGLVSKVIRLQLSEADWRVIESLSAEDRGRALMKGLVPPF